MNRRQSLSGVIALAGAALWPTVIRDAFADGAACEAGGPPKAASVREANVARALQGAAQRHTVLLVLVIPEDDSAKWERGRAWGELLNFGSDEQLAPLAGVEVVCASLAELKKMAIPAPKGEPWGLLVDPSKATASPTALDAKVPEPRDGRALDGDALTLELNEEAASRARIAVLAGAIAAALPLAKRPVAQCAHEVRARLVRRPPPGSKWAVAGGCGVRVEGESERTGIACGMGHVPLLAQRFLYFMSRAR
jgi:hypothetical protein